MSASHAPLSPSSTAFYSLCSFFQPPYPQSPLFHLAISPTPPNLLLQLGLPATFIFPFPSFHIAFLPLLYSLRRLSLPFLLHRLVSFHFLPPRLAFFPLWPSANLTQFIPSVLPPSPFCTLPQFILAHFLAHTPLLFSLKYYLLPFSVVW